MKLLSFMAGGKELFGAVSGDGIVGIGRLIPPNRGAMDGAAFAIARTGKRAPS